MNLDIQLPSFIPEQIEHYQGDHLLSHNVLEFDPEGIGRSLEDAWPMMAIDLGGTKIRKAIYAVGCGKLIRSETETFESRQGRGYLTFLEELARDAAIRNLQVGISSATKLTGSIITRVANLPVFFDEMQKNYDADYENLFPGRCFVTNDTIAGICGSVALMRLSGIETTNAGFMICASGVGASVISDGQAIHVEAAHVPLVNALNPLGQTTPCHLEANDYVCLERVAAAKAGIEPLYARLTGETKSGVELGTMYEAGNELVTLLYETSATALAHAIVGVARRYCFEGDQKSVTVLHGGNFEIPTYRRAIVEALERIPLHHPRVVFSRDLSANVCQDGAALLAWYQRASLGT